MTLQIDAPPDAPARNTGREAARPESAVSLTTLGLREVQAGSLVQQPQRMVWLSDSDRALTYTLEKAAPPISLSIRPVASDWQLEIPGDGFVDVDVEAEARLVLPGNQPALTTARQFVFDGRPPSLELPPAVNADVGIPLVIPVQVVDDPREAFAGSGGSRLPGVSGVDKVEWAVDLKGDGKPEADHKFGTVGVVVLDQMGNLAAGTSTGGMTGKRWGRIGDSPVIGAGTYADNRSCAVSATGHGEYFIRHTVARSICARMQFGGIALEEAADTVVMEELVEADGEGGIVAVDAEGNVALVFNTSGMYRASIDAAGHKVVGIYSDE
ncbi:hypothetical protein EBU58_09685 [bacterium]|nr:hypothetical protein [bacterium]